MSPGDEQSTIDALNRRAAELMGWTNIERLGSTSLWGNEPNDGPDMILMPIPSPDGDYEDALRLLLFTLRHPKVNGVSLSMQGDEFTVNAHVDVHPSPRRDTAMHAEEMDGSEALIITRACVVALEAAAREGSEAK